MSSKFVLGLPFSSRQKKLAKERDRIDKERFVAQIAARGGDARAAETVWEVLQSNVVSDGLTPYPDDSLEYIYGIAEEELDEDLIAHTLEELGIPLPDQEFVNGFGRIDSALRVAQFVSECRRRIG